MTDQRGTGESNPLACPELATPAAAIAPMFPVDAVARCRSALESKADLRYYLTQDAVPADRRGERNSQLSIRAGRGAAGG